MGRQYVKDGQRYTFDSHRLRHEYDLRGTMRGAKTRLIEQLAEASDRPNETVKSWLRVKKPSSPNDPALVSIIERVFGLETNTLLIPVMLQVDDKTTKETAMITERQREIAHALYGELCEMIYFVTDSIGMMDFDPNDPTAGLPRASAPKYHNQEEYRDELILSIRKSGIYLPSGLRNQAIDMVQRAFGPWDAESNDMFFNGEEYAEYLNANGWKDEPSVRYTYSRNFRESLYRELERIFKDYAC